MDRFLIFAIGIIATFSLSSCDQSRPELLAGNNDFTPDLSESDNDFTPDSFKLGEKQAYDLNTWIESEIIKITGIDSDTPISIKGGEYSVFNSEGEFSYSTEIGFTSEPAKIRSNQWIRVRLKSSALFQTQTELTLTIGDVTESFSAITPERRANKSVEWANPTNNSKFAYFYQHTSENSPRDDVGDFQILDYNQDGYDDVLLSTYNPDQTTYDLRLLENKKTLPESFNESILLTNISGGKFKAADIDNDSDIDILSYGTPATKTLRLYRNLGTTFSEKDVWKSAYYSYSNILELVDIDSDNDLDIVMSTGINDKLTLLRNNGDTFNSTHLTNTTWSIREIEFADMDSDGDLDIITVAEVPSPRYNGTFKHYVWLENNYVDFELHYISDRRARFSNFAVTDINGDQHLDLIVDGGTQFYPYINDGAADPEFATSSDSAIEYSITFPFQGFYDLDFDGDLDKFFNRNQHHWYELTGGVMKSEWHGVLEPYNYRHNQYNFPFQFNKTMVGHFSDSEEFSLLRLDPYLGKIVNQFAAQEHHYLEEGESLTSGVVSPGPDRHHFSYELVNKLDYKHIELDTTLGEWTFHNAPSSDTPEDINRDNTYAFIVRVYDDRISYNRQIRVNVYRNDDDDDDDGVPDSEDDQPFNPYSSVDTDRDGRGNEFDYDDDNDKVPDHADHAPLDYRSAGAPSWETSGDINRLHEITDHIRNPSKIISADIDSDGDQDLLIVKDHNFTWLENRLSSGESWKKHATEHERGIKDLVVIDIDSDSDMDIAIASNYGTFIYYNQDRFNPTYQRVEIGDSRVSTVLLVDLENDGDMDILSKGFGSLEHLVWYRYHNDQFEKIEIKLKDNYPVTPTVIEIDSTELANKDDIVNVINQLIVDYPHKFHAFYSLSIGHSLSADFDRDGDNDMFEMIRNSASISFEENKGDGMVCRECEEPLVVINSTLGKDRFARGDGLTMADVNNDGFGDLIFTYGPAGKIYWAEINKQTFYQKDNQRFSKYIKAPDPDSYASKFSIVPGLDADQFKITSYGRLSSNNYLKVDDPKDANQDNRYELLIRASDGFAAIDRRITIAAYKDDNDDDDDGVLDSNDAFPLDTLYSKDLDEDDIPNLFDFDRDGDGVNNLLDTSAENADDSRAPYWNGMTYSVLPENLDHIELSTRHSLIDADSDGDLDIVEPIGDKILLQINDGSDEAPTKAEIITGLENIHSIKGYIDSPDKPASIVLYSFNELFVYESDSLEIGYNSIYTTGYLERIERVELSDVDNDNDTDLIVLYKEADLYKLSIFENTPELEGKFIEHSLMTTQEYITRLFIGDVNNNGVKNVVYRRQEENFWLQKDELIPGNYIEREFISSEYEIEAFADVNGDQYIDLLAYSKLNERQVWFVNKGNDRIEFEREWLDNISSKVRYVADLNNDSRLDLVSYSTGRVATTHINMGNNKYISFDIPRKYSYEGLDSIGDFNGDGITNIISEYTYLLPYHLRLYSVQRFNYTSADGVALNINLTAGDAERQAIAYKLLDGADAAFFSINKLTGGLHFIGADPLAPSDENEDNQYRVTVEATDGKSTNAISVVVAVVPAAEP